MSWEGRLQGKAWRVDSSRSSHRVDCQGGARRWAAWGRWRWREEREQGSGGSRSRYHEESSWITFTNDRRGVRLRHPMHIGFIQCQVRGAHSLISVWSLVGKESEMVSLEGQLHCMVTETCQRGLSLAILTTSTFARLLKFFKANGWKGEGRRRISATYFCNIQLTTAHVSLSVSEQSN